MTLAPDYIPQETRVLALQARYAGWFAPSAQTHANKPCWISGQRHDSVTAASIATGLPYEIIRDLCSGRRTVYHGKKYKAWWDGEEPRVVEVKPRNSDEYRTAAERRRFRLLVAAWKHNPQMSVRQMRRRFNCTLTVCWKARMKSLEVLPPR